MAHQVPWIDEFCGFILIFLITIWSHGTLQSFNKAKYFVWRHDLFEDSMVAAGLSGIETGTKLYISNLHYGVTKEDLQVVGSSYAH
jgi:THO complex subunit 4